MNVNIITKHSSYNFGAMLQAYSLQQAVSKIGVDCKMIDLRQPKPQTMFSWTSPRNIFRNIAFMIHKKDVLEGHNKFEKFIADNYDKTDTYKDEWELKYNIPKADVYISGSDQVWNPLNLQDYYYLDFVPDNAIRASYAASLGISYIPDGAKTPIGEHLSRFDYISVREKNGKVLLSELTDKEINVNIDPVFLLSRDEWQVMSVKPEIKKPYILCYILYRPRWLNKWLKQLHRITGVDIVVVSTDPSRNIFNNKKVTDAGPREFVGLIQNAEFVITSSFHGTALSIVNNKPFYAIVNPDAPSRISNLLEVVGLSNRIISENDDFKLYSIDFSNANKAIKDEKEKSMSYLREVVLNGKKTELIETKKMGIPTGNISIIGNKCTACTTCKKVCPFNAITMEKNKEGFIYPKVNDEKCTNCGLCVRKCHTVIKAENTKKTSTAYYGWHKDAVVRDNSTSGGAFTAFADIILKNGGVVCAAYYNASTKTVCHATTDEISMDKFRKSKYVESEMGDILYSIEAALKRDRQVLFCGTPCQSAGVRRAFGNPDNLYICDFLCHGVPSAKVFKDFLELLENKKHSGINDYRFRTKNYGWSQYGAEIDFDNGKTKTTVLRCQWQYVACMLDDKFLRKSCYTCSKSLYHESDITIGDFWGVFKFNASIDDNKGISLMFANTRKGKVMIENIKETFDLFELEKKYTDYTFKVKTADQKLTFMESEFNEYMSLGCEKYIKKKYRLRMLKYKAVFMVNKRKYKRR